MIRASYLASLLEQGNSSLRRKRNASAIKNIRYYSYYTSSMSKKTDEDKTSFVVLNSVYLFTGHVLYKGSHSPKENCAIKLDKSRLCRPLELQQY